MTPAELVAACDEAIACIQSTRVTAMHWVELTQDAALGGRHLVRSKLMELLESALEFDAEPPVAAREISAATEPVIKKDMGRMGAICLIQRLRGWAAGLTGEKAAGQSGAAPTEWSRPASVEEWRKVFGVSRNTMTKRLREQNPRNERFGRLYRVALDDLPAGEREKFRAPRNG
jgi:hypothetical protein